MKTTSIKLIALIATISIVSSCSNNEEILKTEGKVKRETISIAPKYAGRIVKIWVKESDKVKPGDTLAQLDIPEVEAKIQQATGAVYSASAQYEMASKGATKDQKEQVIAMYEAAKEQFEFAQKSATRIRNMFNDSLVPAQSYDEAMAKLNVARSQYEAAQAKKQEIVGGLRDEQVRMALGQKKQAEGALQEANTVYSERYIIAPKNMSIETIALREGELALPGYNMFVGYEIDATFFRFTLNEKNLHFINKDSTYVLKMPFRDDMTITCKLASINELGRYAFKSTAFPNYQMGEAVYELKMVPCKASEATLLQVNETAILSVSSRK